MARDVRRCGHCYSREMHVAFAVTDREMCEDCISYGDAGKMCGLCKDREDGLKRWQRLADKGATTLPFDEWYDVNA